MERTTEELLAEIERQRKVIATQRQTLDAIAAHTAATDEMLDVALAEEA